MKILCDFYNLYLKSGRQEIPQQCLTSEQLNQASRENKAKMEVPGHTVVVTGEVWPDANECQRILDFFERYCPEALTLLDAQSVEAKRVQRKPVVLSNYEISSLGEYEYTNKKSWFKSEDYLDFVGHWRNIRLLLDSVIARQLDLPLLMWFSDLALHWKEPRPEGQPDKKGYTLSVSLMNPEGNPVEPVSLWEKDQKTQKNLPLGEWNVKESHTFPIRRYGINIGFMLYGIHRYIIHAMEDSTIFGRCAAEKTPKRPACQNIFLHGGRGRNKDYCSIQCRKRDYMAKRRKKNKKLR